MQNTKKPTIIGIAGGTSSGKTTIANRLYDEAIKTGTVALIKIDDYYHNKDKVQRTETGKANYDHPDSYDTDYLIKQLNELKMEMPLTNLYMILLFKLVKLKLNTLNQLK